MAGDEGQFATTLTNDEQWTVFTNQNQWTGILGDAVERAVRLTLQVVDIVYKGVSFPVNYCRQLKNKAYVICTMKDGRL